MHYISSSWYKDDIEYHYPFKQTASFTNHIKFLSTLRNLKSESQLVYFMLWSAHKDQENYVN